MLPTLLVVLPIFAIIFTGWASAKTKILGSNAMTELNRFVIYLALPALLFQITATSHGSQLWQPGFIIVFTMSSFIVFFIGLLIALKSKATIIDAAISGTNAAYPNTAYMGFPLSLLAFGTASLTVTTIATIITVCVTFAFAIILIEISQQHTGSPLQIIAKTALSLIKNPLLISPFLGALYSASGLPLPEPAQQFLKLLGGSASPCALVALGLFLAKSKPITKSALKITASLVGLKLIIHPIIVYILGAYIFALSDLYLHVAVLIAALPTGTGSFMLAEYYHRDATITSNSILLSTIISVLTVTIYLMMVS